MALIGPPDEELKEAITTTLQQAGLQVCGPLVGALVEDLVGLW